MKSVCFFLFRLHFYVLQLCCCCSLVFTTLNWRSNVQKCLFERFLHRFCVWVGELHWLYSLEDWFLTLMLTLKHGPLCRNPCCSLSAAHGEPFCFFPARCHGQRICNITKVMNSLDELCPRRRSYLSVEYHCIDGMLCRFLGFWIQTQTSTTMRIINSINTFLQTIVYFAKQCLGEMKVDALLPDQSNITVSFCSMSLWTK